MAEDIQFCPYCGRKFSEQRAVCNECGCRIPGVIIRLSEPQKEKIRTDLRNYSKLAGYILIAYSVPLLIMGLCRVISSQGLVDFIWYAPGTASVAERWDFTMDDLKYYVDSLGIGWALSGVTGVVAAMVCFARRYYWVALLFITASVIFSTTGVFTLFMGMVAYWYLLSSKFAFAEYTALLEEEIGDMAERPEL